MRKGSNLLVIDVGGTNVKFLATGQKNVVKIPSGLRMTPALMVEELQKVIGQFKYTGVSIGYPGPVVNGRPASEPRAGLGGVRLRAGVRLSGEDHQRRRHASPRQL
jgi:predicted NBD/HSP70 family sugar kinase